MIQSRCGLLCDEYAYRAQTGCKGCSQMDKPFWADSCPVKSCCESKERRHCGECNEFVCSLLHSFAYDAEQGDDGRRLEQCRLWKREKR